VTYPTADRMEDRSSRFDPYDAQYGHFASQIYTEAFGEDIGRTGWLTADEVGLRHRQPRRDDG
jgi:hypothetical protein